MQAVSCVVSSVTKDAIGLVQVMEDQRHNLLTGDVVTFNSIQGMTEVWVIKNACQSLEANLPCPDVEQLMSAWSWSKGLRSC